MAQCLVATGNDGNDPVGRNTEGGRQFAGIQHTQSSAGSSSQVKEPSAPFETWFDGLYQGFDLRYSLLHSLSHQGILLVDMVQQFSDRHLFEVVEM